MREVLRIAQKFGNTPHEIFNLKNPFECLHRSSVVNNKAELQATVVSTIGSVEKEISLYNKQALASAQSEREALQEEIQQLKAKIHSAESATAEQLVHLQSMKKDYGAQLSRAEEIATQKLNDARYEKN